MCNVNKSDILRGFSQPDCNTKGKLLTVEPVARVLAIAKFAVQSAAYKHMASVYTVAVRGYAWLPMVFTGSCNA